MRPVSGTELKITAFGKTLNAHEWNRIYHVPTKAIRNRIYKGWDPERAVSEPLSVSPQEKDRRRRKTMQRYL